MNLKKHIPNLLTICNLLCGCFAVKSAFTANYEFALIFVLAAAVFDFLDGFAARLLKAYSPIGKELDSLADVISFGLTPAVIACKLLSDNFLFLDGFLIPSGLLIAAFSALRLAKFNVDDRQTDSFIGLAVPANAIFWAGLANSHSQQLADFPIITILLIAISCFLLVCSLPMFSLKFKSLKWKDNAVRYIFILLSLVILVISLIMLGNILAFLYLVIVLYILMSVVLMFTCKNKADLSSE